MKPRLLDLFCGAGGCSVGYARAGFEVVGVDIAPQPNYPFEFLQDDAVALLSTFHPYSRGWWDEPPFDAIHTSPPCQFYSDLGADGRHRGLIPEVRELLEATGLPWVIENIEDASEAMNEPVLICGTMFDPILDVRRHRLFETSWGLRHPDWPCRHSLSDRRFDVYEHGRWRKRRFVPVYGTGGGKEGTKWGSAMGIDWMTRGELKEAIPPAYTEFIGEQLISLVGAAR